MQRRLVAELGRAGDDVDGADHFRDSLDGTHDLEGQLRHAIAEGGERHALEHDIGEAAIGGNDVGAFLGDDERIGLLRLVADVDAHGHCRQVEFLTVSPYAAHEGDRAFAQANREVGEIAVADVDLRGARGRRRLAARARYEGNVGLFDQACRPDHLAADSRATVDARQRRALHGGQSCDPCQARADLDTRAHGRARRQKRAAEAAERLAGERAERTRDELTDGRADGGENERGHELCPYLC